MPWPDKGRRWQVSKEAGVYPTWTANGREIAFVQVTGQIVKARVATEGGTFVVEALNQLLHRLATTLENERRFTADAAHELRTPLAALKVQTQVAMATQDAAMQRHALGQVLAGADLATPVVEHLLRLARLDPIARLP